MDILKEQDKLKREAFENRLQIAHNTYAVLFLERAYTEMKVFIEKVLNEVFHAVDKSQNQIYEAIEAKKKNAGIYVAQNKDNALGLYCQYLNFVKPIEVDERRHIYEDEIGTLT